jgi:hypothetical protein
VLVVFHVLSGGSSVVGFAVGVRFLGLVPENMGGERLETGPRRNALMGINGSLSTFIT